MVLASTMLIPWIYLSSAIILMEGIAYARFSTGALAPRLKRLAYSVIGAILLSEIYNFLRKQPISSHYQVWLGFKVLLVLHISAAVIFHRRKPRALTGVAIFGFANVPISEYPWVQS